MAYLLDTHILLWWFSEEPRLSKNQLAALEGASDQEPLSVSDISLWEIAMLESLGRIVLRGNLRDWLEVAVAPPLVRRLGISPSVAATVASLPDSFHRDPADRIIVATAMVHGASLLTADRRIIDSGLVETL